MPQVAVQASQIIIALGRSTADGHHHVLRWWCRPQIFMWPSLLSWAMAINTDPSYSRIMDPDMVFYDSMDPGITMASEVCRGHLQQSGPQGTAWSMVINLASGCCIDHRHPDDPYGVLKKKNDS